ncbi:hypothetical protein ATCC90586_011957 [Pythium insidiosum]|nr:hypothetical protein ATCC90586_011957 [Pythium insidiosum]
MWSRSRLLALCAAARISTPVALQREQAQSRRLQGALLRLSDACAGWRALSSRGDAAGGKRPVELRAEDLEESFVKGWGKGGQKINKVRNCVLLKHVPTGLHVRCQETRSLDGNRRIARKLLLQKLDDHVNGALSKRNQKIEKLRKKKANRRSKSKQKYSALAAGDAECSEEEEEDEDEETAWSEDEEEDEDDVEVVDIDMEAHKVRSKKSKPPTE